MVLLPNQRLKDVLPDFQSFLIDRKLTHEKYVPFYALSVSQFLAFANKDKERDMETLVKRFLDYLKVRENVSDGLIKQARDALTVYLYQYKDGIRFRKPRLEQVQASVSSKVVDVLSEMKHLMRVKHYSYGTEQTYLGQNGSLHM